jgi:S-DNA-T family DNA segregation ATPase FtsK/SpoIIIE
MIALPVLGLWHIWAGAPLDPMARRDAAGFTGFVIGGPLSEGLTVWIATPLLVIGVLFGVLLLTGTTIRELPLMLRDMFSTRAFEDDDYDEYDEYDDEYDDEAVTEDFSDAYYDRDEELGGTDDQQWPTPALPAGSPMDNYPLPEEPVPQRFPNRCRRPRCASPRPNRRSRRPPMTPW